MPKKARKEKNMTILRALIVSIIYYFTDGYSGFGGFYVSKYMLRQPLIGGFLCGLVYGDIQGGLELGVTLQLAYMGVFAVGGAQAMDIGAVSYPTVALALASGVDAGTAVALAAPISTLAANIDNASRIANNFFNNLFVKGIEEGNRRKWELAYNVYPQVVLILLKVVPSFILIYLGTPSVEAILEFLPATLLAAMSKFAKILPAIGMGMLLKYIVNGPWSFAFFLLGFAMYSYNGMNFLNIAIISVIIAYFYYRTSLKPATVVPVENNDDEEEL